MAASGYTPKQWKLLRRMDFAGKGAIDYFFIVYVFVSASKVRVCD